MDANSNQNLFRLSLPEWLKDEVDSGNHKGVYWTDKEKKTFHVPWKHASRNGWEDNDVSLFKAWAIYTNRYREGIDEPRPASWKTNFRCAINSHNSIVFLKDQGEKKGDSAHRVMQLLDTPKKPRKIINANKKTPTLSSSELQPPRKLVRLTYPNVSEKSNPKAISVVKSTANKKSKILSIPSIKQNKQLDCTECYQIKLKVQDALKNIGNDVLSLSSSFATEYRKKFVDLLTSKEHICSNNTVGTSIIVTNAQSNAVSEKANLQDLYKFGKALQEGKSDNDDGSDDDDDDDDSLEAKEEMLSDQTIDNFPDNAAPAAVIIALNNDCKEEVVISPSYKGDKECEKKLKTNMNNEQKEEHVSIAKLNRMNQSDASSSSKSNIIFNSNKKYITIKTELGDIPLVIYDMNTKGDEIDEESLINPRK